MNTFPAHIRLDKDGEHIQPAETHNRNTAQRAGNSLSDISLANAAYIAGLVHDAGKLTEASRQYQFNAAYHPEKAIRGSVNHTFAGVRLLLETFHDCKTAGGFASLTSEILAFAAGAHHGLFDCTDEHSQSGFTHRMTRPDIYYEEARENFFKCCAAPDELERLFRAADSEIQAVYQRILGLVKNPSNAADEGYFYLGLLTRLILSAVIDGDRCDTAEFMQNFTFPASPQGEERKQMWRTLLTRVERKLNGLPADTAINRARRILSDRCRAQASRPGGIYRFNLPTGAGKTLTSLRYALAHAAEHNKSRIIFLSPLLSILDQNAQVIRDYIQDDSIVCEHHSNMVRPAEKDELDPLELLTENWDAPIIISTLVQFLNTLFSSRTGCIRRFQSLCSSVIIIDEVQTVPLHMLTLFNLAINFLSTVCGATVILMSATQPCLEQTVHPLASPCDLVAFDAELWRVFQRVRLLDGGKRALNSFPDFVLSVLEDADSLLVVCNKKSEVTQLYHALKDGDVLCFHLSASMCMAHRRKMLKELQEALDDSGRSQKILCISSQVIEAGVDISFSAAIRFTAGMDSAVQTAGRCNRNGEKSELCPVYIVQCSDENLYKLNDIQDAKTAALALLTAFAEDPSRFQYDLTSDASIRYYYSQLYANLAAGAMDYVLPDLKCSLFQLLSTNMPFTDITLNSALAQYNLHQAFKTAGSLFTVFDEDTTDVLVPYDEGKKIITALCSLREPYPLSELKPLLEQAKPYTVSLYRWQVKALEQQDALVSLCGGRILALCDGHYDEATGLVVAQQSLPFLEV